MTRLRALLAGVCLAFAAAVPQPAVAQPAAVNLTGKWLITITTDAGGTSTPTITLTQKGDTLTGHYVSQLLGETDVVGRVGSDGTFEFHFDVQGNTVSYAGKIESKDALKGTAKFGDLAAGPFTAKRQ